MKIECQNPSLSLVSQGKSVKNEDERVSNSSHFLRRTKNPVITFLFSPLDTFDTRNFHPFHNPWNYKMRWVQMTTKEKPKMHLLLKQHESIKSLSLSLSLKWASLIYLIARRFLSLSLFVLNWAEENWEMPLKTSVVTELCSMDVVTSVICRCHRELFLW